MSDAGAGLARLIELSTGTEAASPEATAEAVADPPRPRWPIAIALGSLVGAAVGVVLLSDGDAAGTADSATTVSGRARVGPERAPVPAPEGATLGASTAETDALAGENRVLREQVALLESEVATLEEETTDLQRELLDLDLQLAARDTDRAGTPRPPMAAGTPVPLSGSPPAAPPGADEGLPTDVVDRARLETGGVDELTGAMVAAAFATAARERDLIELGAADPEADPADVEAALHRVRDELLATVGVENYIVGRYAASEPNRVDIVRVPPDGAAARVGIEPGDTLATIDGRRVFDLDDVERYGGAGDGPLELEILRDGARFTVVFDGALGELGLRAESIDPALYDAD